MYAKTSQGRFVVAKHAGEGELFLQVNRKDASLTDAEREPHHLSGDCETELRRRREVAEPTSSGSDCLTRHRKGT